MKKTLIIVLCIILAAALCATFIILGKRFIDNSPDPSDTDGATEGETILSPTEKPTESQPTDPYTNEFAGEKLVLLSRDTHSCRREWGKEEAEDELDETIEMRKSFAKETLGIEFEVEYVPWSEDENTRAQFNDLILDDILGGLHKYDAVVNHSSYATTAALRGCYADLLGEEFTSFDFSHSGWNQSMRENTIGGKLYYMTGDMNITQFDNSVVVWHNRSLWTHVYEEGDESLVESVHSGKWDLELMNKWITVAYDRYSPTDRAPIEHLLGLGVDDVDGSLVLTDAVPTSWQLDFVIGSDADGRDFNYLENDRADSALERLKALYASDRTATDVSVDRFATEKVLFYVAPIYTNYEENMTRREMDDKHELLPMPKLSSEQEKYITYTLDGFSVFSVLDHSKSSVKTKSGAIAMYFQYSAEKSYEDVRDYYCYRVVKVKLFGDSTKEYGELEWPRSMFTMFNMATENIVINFDQLYSSELEYPTHLWREAVESGETLEDAFGEQMEAIRQALQMIYKPAEAE